LHHTHRQRRKGCQVPFPPQNWKYALMAGWRMASTAMRLATVASCASTFYSSTDLISSPRCLDHFSKRRVALALRKPAISPRKSKTRNQDVTRPTVGERGGGI